MTAATMGASRRRAMELDHLDGVATRDELAALGITTHSVNAQLAADRWSRLGRAIVLHNGEPTRNQLERAALINVGPRAVLTSFTAAARWGLRDWSRPEIHVLAPAGTKAVLLPNVVVHLRKDWSYADIVGPRSLHRIAPALIIAASSFRSSRPGCGLLAAAAQQRLTTPADLLSALDRAPRTRHRSALVLAVHDIGQGAHALSEIDLRRICRRWRLPAPNSQSIRNDPTGRRRYLDADWILPDGRVVVVEIDGAYHLSPMTWMDDQLRQNEVVLDKAVVLRFPSVVVRDDQELVATQLSRALGVPLTRPR